jgi:MFS family permease
MVSVPRQVPQATHSASLGHGVAGRATRALWAAAVVGGLAQSLAGSAGALLAVEVTRSDAAGGLPQAMLVAGSAAAALGLSAVAARRGRRASLATGAGAAVAGCALVTAGAAESSLAGVLVGSLLLGAGNTAVMLARYAAADLAADGARARAMGRLLVATTVGAVLGPNLLRPAGWLGARLALPALGAPYLIAGLGLARMGLPAAPTEEPRPCPRGRRWCR